MPIFSIKHISVRNFFWLCFLIIGVDPIIFLYNASMWLLFSILAPLLWAVGNPIDGALRRNWIKDDMFMTGLFALTKLPVAIGFMVIFGQGIVLGWPFFWMFFAGIIWMLGFVFYYKAMQIEEVSRVVLFLQFQPIIIFIIGAMMLGETLSFSQFIAFLLIFSGSILAAIKKSESKWHFSKAFLFIFVADIIWALADVMFKKFAVYFPNFWSAFAVDLFGSSILGLFLFFLPKYRIVFKNFRLPIRGWSMLFISATVGTIGSLAFAYALILGKVALTSVIMGIQPFFAFIFALLLHFFFKEIPRESIAKANLLVKLFSFVLIVSGLVYLYY